MVCKGRFIQSGPIFYLPLPIPLLLQVAPPLPFPTCATLVSALRDYAALWWERGVMDEPLGSHHPVTNRHLSVMVKGTPRIWGPCQASLPSTSLFGIEVWPSLGKVRSGTVLVLGLGTAFVFIFGS